MIISNSSLATARRAPQRLSETVEHVLVVHARDLRWEVSHNGVTRPMVDWLFSRERAIEHAYEIANELLARPGRTQVLLVVEDGDEGWEELLE